MLALNHRLTERFAEKVVRSVTAAMALVAADRQHHVPVLLVVCHNLLETARHVEKFLALAHRAFEEDGLEECLF